MIETFRVEAFVTSRPRGAALARGVRVAGGAALASSVVLALDARSLPPLVAIVLTGGAVALLAAGMLARGEGPERTIVHVDARELRVGARVFSRDRIVAASRSAGDAHVELADGSELSIRCSPSEAAQLVAALGFAGRVRTLVVGGMPEPGAQRFATTLFVLLAMLSAPLLLGFLLTVAEERAAGLVFALLAASTTFATFQLGRRVRRTTLAIGRDAIRVRGRTLRLDRLETQTHERVIALESGIESVKIACASEEEARSVLVAIDEARAGAAPCELDVSPLRRNGDDLEAWRARLRELVRGGYRAALGPDDLARVVEDATQAGEVRVAAAFALSSLHEAAEERARVRVAAESIAHPHLRIAIERAEAGEIDTDAIEELARDG